MIAVVRLVPYARNPRRNDNAEQTVRRWQQYTGRTATLEATGEPFPTQATACTQLSRHSGVGRNPGGGDNKTSIYHAFLDFSYRKPSRRQSPQPFLTPAFAGETVPLRCVHTVALRRSV